MFEISTLPTLNAILNATSAVLLVAGYACIRRGNVPAHRACMLAAVVVSTLFLASYVYYHFHAGRTAYPGSGWLRPVYYAILFSHTLLAMAIVPLVAVTLYRALRGQWQRHRKLARWTLPLWLYVSVTGVVIYVMLYRM